MATKESQVAPIRKNLATPSLPRLLNLGCGNDYHEGWLNVDLSPEVKADQHFDAFSFPWDLPDSYFDQILISHLVEHIPHRISGVAGDGFYTFFEEVYRILGTHGVAEVRVPFWKHPNATLDPTHIRIVHKKTFDFFNPGHISHYVTTAKFKVQSKVIWSDRFIRKVNDRFGWRLPGIRRTELRAYLSKLV